MQKTLYIFRDHQSNIYKSAIMLMAFMLAISTVLMTSCDGGSNDYAEAEAEVSAELEAIKSGSSEISALTDLPDDISEAMLESYAEKLRDFEYVIAGSSKSEDDESIIVTVNITTYDFGSVYLETWNDRMKIEESLRYESQFYTDLFTRFIALSVKNYTGQAEIVCTRSEDGSWGTDIKTNQQLMNAISGGMVAEIEELAEE